MHVHSVNHSLNVHVLKSLFLFFSSKPFFVSRGKRIDLGLLKRAKRDMFFSHKSKTC